MSRSESAEPSFSVWVRRQLDANAPYAIRFEVSEGRGILRVTRPGVLIDPPARPTGEEEGLIGPQVRASRFLHARDGGRSRSVWGFVRLDDGVLERLPVDAWVQLDADGAAQQLLARGGLPSVDDHPPGDETTSPQRMLEELRDDLSNPRSPAQAQPPAEDEPPLAGWGTDLEVREPAPPTPAPVSEVLVAGDVTDEEDLHADLEEGTGEAVQAPPPPVEAAPADPQDPSRFHSRRTTLVRYFRRRIQAEQLRTMALQAELEAARGRGA